MIEIVTNDTVFSVEHSITKINSLIDLNRRYNYAVSIPAEDGTRKVAYFSSYYEVEFQVGPRNDSSTGVALFYKHREVDYITTTGEVKQQPADGNFVLYTGVAPNESVYIRHKLVSTGTVTNVLVNTTLEGEQDISVVQGLIDLSKTYNYTVSIPMEDGTRKVAYFSSDYEIEFAVGMGDDGLRTLYCKYNGDYKYITTGGALTTPSTIDFNYARYYSNIGTGEVYVRNSLIPLGTLDSVSNLTAEYIDNSVKLNWDMPSLEDGRIAGIVIKRVLEDNTTHLFDTTDTSVCEYIDTNIEKGVNYTYIVQLHNADGEFYDEVTVDVFTKLIEYIYPKRFGTCGKIGPTIPSINDVTSYYNNTTLKGQVDIQNGKQTFIIPRKGNYQLTAAGARGGAGCGPKNVVSCKGGLGAKLAGNIILCKNDKLEILVGQRGTDHSGTSGDGTTGAGGGATFVVYHKYNTETEDYMDPVLLIAAAGGNGGRDYGYSGDGAVYNGSATTPSSAPSIGTNPGGGYNTSSSDSTTGGRSFLQGGAAATSAFERNGKSQPGFGGGGANKDDGEGGGGGGYYGGHITSSAYSYINEELFSDIVRVSGDNYGNGYLEIVESVVEGYFLKNTNNEILYYDNSQKNWVPVEGDLTYEIISEYGLAELDMELTILEPTSTIIKCVSEVTDVITYTVVALPKTTMIPQIVDVDLTDKLLIGMNISATNEVSVLVSCNQGETWMYFNGETWVDYAGDYVGMSVDVTNKISKNLWNRLPGIENNLFRLSFIINSTDYTVVNKVNSIIFKTIDIN